MLLIKPHSRIDFPNYALSSTTVAMDIVKRQDHPHVRMLYDIYHAQMSEGNLIDTMSRYLQLIEHIQIADMPGSHEPGTGEIRYPAIFSALDDLQYNGYIGLEYCPSRDTIGSLSWLPIEDRA